MAELMEFNVLLLGIVFDTKNKKILVGRRENDPHLKELSWSFPGGSPASHEEELDISLKRKIKEMTGLDVENLGVIFAKNYPEKKDLLSVYYLCESVGGEEKIGGDFLELKWVDPEEIENHFTTSFHPHLKEYILNLK